MPVSPRGPEAPRSVAKGVDTGLEDGQEAHQAVDVEVALAVHVPNL